MNLSPESEHNFPAQVIPATGMIDADIQNVTELHLLERNEHDTELRTLRHIQSRIKPSEKHALITDSLELFKEEAARYPRLDRAEEIALAKLADKGRAAAEQLDKFPDTQGREYKAAQRAIGKGVEAKELLLLTNLKLVFFVSKKFPQHIGMNRLDLVQEGTFGLQRAAEHFDWRQGFKFSTYAYPSIYRSMQRAIEQRARLIRAPVAGQIALKHALQESNGEYDPTLDGPMQMVAAANSPLSIDKALYEDNDTHMKSTLKDPRTHVEKEVLDKLDVAQVMELIATLPEQDATIVRLYLGIDTGEPIPLREIARQFGKKHAWANYRCRKSMLFIREMWQKQFDQ